MRVINLSQKEIPRKWYNLLADLPWDLPAVLHPATNEPVSEDDLAPVFARELIRQEFTKERWIEIPEPVLEVYGSWRPTPLRRALALEKALNTPARIYFKDESVSPTGSHKPNTAVAQAYYNRREGVKRITTETGAGQWGSAMAFASSKFDLECRVFMVRVSYEQKPYRKVMMRIWGADVVPSPSKETNSGRKILEADPNSPGSLGIAISEAVESAVQDPDTRYVLGSVLNHVLLHQSIIGLELEKQLAMIGEKPDVMIGCVGGGSNFGGFVYPFIPKKLHGEEIEFIAVEPKACPTLTEGQYRYDFGDTAGLTPLLKMFTLGYDFVPSPIHAGGLRYHGMAPVVSLLVEKGIVTPRAYGQDEVFESAVMFAKAEGIVPAPESAHAVKCAIDEAIACREEGREKVIVFALSGHGLFDLSAYERFLNGEL